MGARITALVPCVLALTLTLAPAPSAAQEPPLRVFVSVDMEGVGGIGTGEMASSDGKDYALGRRLMTDEVNAVVEALRSRGPVEILVNDSHGDMQNLLHTELDASVEYVQGSVKPLGMVQGLDSTFDAAVFLGYHARAGAEGFLAHTGSGSVKGLWLNGVEVGEGGLNAAYAGHVGVPVILAAGDSAFTEEIAELVDGVTVSTKRAVTPQVARLLHPDVVRRRLREGVEAALARREAMEPWDPGAPVEVRMRFDTPTRADILQAVPGMERVDGTTVAYAAEDMDEAYRLIRLMYKYIAW